MENRRAFWALRKAGTESVFLICGGIWFQIFGLQMEKAHFLNWLHVLTTTAALAFAFFSKSFLEDLSKFYKDIFQISFENLHLLF